MTVGKVSPMISVVVCTHNREDLLGCVLDSLCRQSIDAAYYEIIVIDNGSVDRTLAVVDEYAKRCHNVRYCFEPTLGHAPARNRGWQEAAGTYVAYIDDDATAPENWLSTACHIIEGDPVGLFGGPYFAVYQSPKPSWYKDEYGSAMTTLDAHELHEYEFLSATNLFVRRDLLETLGGFDVRFGGVGSNLGYGEETELQKHIRTAVPGEKIHFDPNLYVFHLVKPQRMSIVWNLRSRFILGGYHYHLFAGEQLLTANLFKVLGGFLLLAADLAVRMTLGLVLRDRRAYPYWQNYVYEQGLRNIARLGKLFEHGRILVAQRFGTSPGRN